ncbi:MAG: hypothetical protein ACSHX3_11870 [Litorimonas sp.]
MLSSSIRFTLSLLLIASSAASHRAYAQDRDVDKARIGVCHQVESRQNDVQLGEPIRKIGGSAFSKKTIVSIEGYAVHSEIDVLFAVAEKLLSNPSARFISAKLGHESVDLPLCPEVKYTGEEDFEALDFWDEKALIMMLRDLLIAHVDPSLFKVERRGRLLDVFALRSNGEKELSSSWAISNEKNIIHIIYIEDGFEAAFREYFSKLGRKHKVQQLGNRGLTVSFPTDASEIKNVSVNLPSAVLQGHSDHILVLEKTIDFADKAIAAGKELLPLVRQ